MIKWGIYWQETFSNFMEINQVLNQLVWGVPMIIILMGTGIYFSFGLKFFQLRWFRYINWRQAKNHYKEMKYEKDGNSISEIQALLTALAATIGTGNIIGVATAIQAGGRGAVFWMWVSAFLGMIIKYAENVLGIYYRYRNSKGEWMGGPMVYIERGMKLKSLATIFACCCFVATFGIGNIAQINGISTSLESTFGIDPMLTGTCVAIFTGIIVFGGLKRIVSFSRKLVPFMAGFYSISALIIILFHVDKIPGVFMDIFEEAFSLGSVGGGITGYIVSKSIRYGMARGIFSNEAGLGTSVMIHTLSEQKEPVIQGIWGGFEVFIDTMIICTLTALAILTTDADKVIGLTGVNITFYAFHTVLGKGGAAIVTIAVVLFAFTTLIGWSIYGMRAGEYFGGSRYILVFKILFVVLIFIGANTDAQFVWALADTCNGLMAVPNAIAIVALSGKVFKITENFLQRKKGVSVLPMRSYLEEPIKK